jgi:hypothetical protein
LGNKSKRGTEPASQMLHSVLVPLCKLLIKRGVGVGELIEAAKVAYIRAAVNEIVPFGARVNVSRLSVVTGLTRREVSALLHRENKTRTMAPVRKVMQQRALRALHGWNVDYSFQKANGRPADLPLKGDQRSFSLLVKRYAGDVTPTSVLRELERMKVVRMTPSKKISLRRRTIESDTHLMHQMSDIARLFKDFANTVEQLSQPKDPPLFFGFKDSTVASPHQAALFQRTFSKRAAALLESIDQWMAHQAKAAKVKSAGQQAKTRVGLGVYLVQEQKQ